MHAWYSETLIAGKIENAELHTLMAGVRQHERMLTDEGLVLLKFWIHLSKAAQKKRLKSLQKDPKTRWKVGDTEWADWAAVRGFGPRIGAAYQIHPKTFTG